MSTLSTNYHPWIGSLQVELDALEAALLRGDAPAVELASAAMQKVLQQAPPVYGHLLSQLLTPLVDCYVQRNNIARS